MLSDPGDHFIPPFKYGCVSTKTTGVRCRYSRRVSTHRSAHKFLLITSLLLLYNLDVTEPHRNFTSAVAKIKCYWQTTRKFGIRLPKMVTEALAIDD